MRSNSFAVSSMSSPSTSTSRATGSIRREPNSKPLGRRLTRHAAISRLCPAQHGVDPRRQLTGRERLDDIVIGAHFEAGDPVHFVASASEKDDRNVTDAPQLLQQVPTILVTEHDVDQHQVGVRRSQRFGRGRDRLDLVSVGCEEAGEQPAHFGVIFDDQDPRTGGIPAGDTTLMHEGQA